MASHASGARRGDPSFNMQSSSAKILDPFEEEYGDYGTNVSEADIDTSERKLLEVMGVMPPYQPSKLTGDQNFREAIYGDNEYEEDSWEGGLEAIEAFDWDRDPFGNQDCESRNREETSESTPNVAVPQREDLTPEDTCAGTPLELLTPLNDDAGEPSTSDNGTTLCFRFPKTPDVVEHEQDEEIASALPLSAPPTPYHDAQEQPAPGSPGLADPSSDHVTSPASVTITAPDVSQDLENEGTVSGPTEQQSALCTSVDHAQKLDSELVDSDKVMEDRHTPDDIEASIAQTVHVTDALVPPVPTNDQSSTLNGMVVDEAAVTDREVEDVSVESGHDQEQAPIVTVAQSEAEPKELSVDSDSGNDTVEIGPISQSLIATDDPGLATVMPEDAHASSPVPTALASTDLTDVAYTESETVEAHVGENIADEIKSTEQPMAQECNENEEASPETVLGEAPTDAVIMPSAAPLPVAEVSEPKLAEPDVKVHDSGNFADEELAPVLSGENTQLPVTLPFNAPSPSQSEAGLPMIIEGNATSDTHQEIEFDTTPKPEECELADSSDMTSTHHETADTSLKLKIESRIWNEALPFPRPPDSADASVTDYDTPGASAIANDPILSETENTPAPNDARMEGGAEIAFTSTEEGTQQPFLAGLEEAAAGLPIATSIESGSAATEAMQPDVLGSSSSWPGSLLEKHLELSASPSGTSPQKTNDTGSQHEDEAATDNPTEILHKANDLSPKRDTPQAGPAPRLESAEANVTDMPPDASAFDPPADEPPTAELEPPPAPPMAGKKKRARTSAKKAKATKNPAAAFVPDGQSGSDLDAPKKKQKTKAQTKTPTKLPDQQELANVSPDKSAPESARSKPQSAEGTLDHKDQPDKADPAAGDDGKAQLQDPAVSASGTTTEPNTLIAAKQDETVAPPGTKQPSSSTSTTAPTRAARRILAPSYGKRETRGEVKMRLDDVERAKREEELANANPVQEVAPSQAEEEEDDDDEVIDLVDGDFGAESNTDQTPSPPKPKGKGKAKATPTKAGSAKTAKAVKASGAAGAAGATPRATRSKAGKASTASASGSASPTDGKNKFGFKAPKGRKRKSTEAFQKEETPQSEGAQLKRRTRHASAVQRKMEEENNVGKRTRSSKKT